MKNIKMKDIFSALRPGVDLVIIFYMISEIPFHIAIVVVIIRLLLEDAINFVRGVWEFCKAVWDLENHKKM